MDSSLGSNFDALKDGFGQIAPFQGCGVNLGPKKNGGEDMPLLLQ